MIRHERKLHERAVGVARRADAFEELLIAERKSGDPIDAATAHAIRGQALIMALLEERDLEQA